MHGFLSKILVAALMVASFGAQAVDTVTSAPAADNLRTARELIANKNWSSAIDELKRVNAVNSADWNNLMGYSLRKVKTPDLQAAESFYDAALKINPQHRGALEYSGELYLVKGDLPKAEQRLASLDKACLLPCDEYSKLKKSVQQFKANGNRYVATQ